MRSKYWWLANVQRTIRAYPELRERKDAVQAQSITAAYSADPRGGGSGRTTEMAALRSLAPAEEAALEAVELALAEEDLMGIEGRRYVQMHYWQRMTSKDVALRMHVSYRTTLRWNNRFVRRVAKHLGLYDRK